MLMALGTFVFSLEELAYQQLQRQTRWRHAETARVGARPARQFLGPGEDQIKLSGLIAPEITGDPASLKTLREMAAAGRPNPLVAGNGEVIGNYLLLDINETQTLHFADGTPRRIQFDITLDRGEDDPAEDTPSA